MKTRQWWFLLAILIATLALASACAPTFRSEGDGLVVGQSYRLRSGETLNNDLTVVGGSAVLETGSTVNGNVAILGGSLSIDGEITGDVSAMGGVVSIGDTAIINGDVLSLGATISKSEKAIIRGNIGAGRPGINLPSVSSQVSNSVNFLWRLIAPIFQSMAIATLAVLVSLFALRPMERIRTTMLTQPVLAGGLGLLSIVVLPILLVLVAITIILLPVSLLGILGLAIALLLGWISAGLLVGERLAEAFKTSWSPPVSAGIGTLILSLAAALANGIIPCIGWIVPFLVIIISLGGIILTRFGMTSYPPPSTSSISPVPPPDAGSITPESPAS
ncbi:MAG TPA: polymer-forming cytoskeletal protein [Anaerolinea thermolimosa]|uniref:Polymer-forming cytoskeletal protein n=1 Tax=Anaerolinea thermolimosa TaxID=229919 RepID=A0A3D1JHN5_9CHLR|nr:polymer-forming cytoskeletal protein [Anaerolinea thermolimosa]GAP07156.1 archaeal/vacuolar-type H+-ATPase subunit I [Anaerolinea thermolimosa]HCE18022.1 polymer-forming cytoskeletal protein [Anaerolinea thermolimosa]